MVGRSKLDEIFVFSHIKSVLCFFLRLWRQRVALMKESSQVFLLNLSRDHDFLAVEEMNWLADSWLPTELIEFFFTYTFVVDQKIVLLQS